MSLINEKVIEKFAEWAIENEDRDVFAQASEKEPSYYITRDSKETYMMEYSFNTAVELQKALEEYCGVQLDSAMLKMLVIEICQNRLENKLETYVEENGNSTLKEIKVKDDEAKLPEFIYIF